MHKIYNGPERRKSQRRVAMSERREMVRYDLNKTPRRSGKDRRALYSWDAIPASNVR
jgi:hypothetical protein